ncbi:hypothetical protein SO694_000950112 [Aureococcus anophagefferens]|uniref:Uncharacterized protein n=1 Tax=Aureococcus anophagefferens TaxID=44056 RepID=A0ABR1FSD3_AURAN
MHVIIRATVLSCAFTFAARRGGVKLDKKPTAEPAASKAGLVEESALVKELPPMHSKPDGIVAGKHSKPDGIVAGKHSKPDGNVVAERSAFDGNVVAEHSKPDGIVAGKHSKPDGIVAGKHSKPDGIRFDCVWWDC